MITLNLVLTPTTVAMVPGLEDIMTEGKVVPVLQSLLTVSHLF